MPSSSRRLLTLVYLLILATAVRADEQPEPSKLPGSSIQTDDAIKRSDIIVVATIDSLHRLDPNAMGRTEFMTEITPVKVLRGPEKMKAASFILKVEVSPGNEVSPKAAQSYVFFFAAHAGSQVTFIKMMPGNDASIVEISKLIAVTSDLHPVK